LSGIVRYWQKWPIGPRRFALPRSRMLGSVETHVAGISRRHGDSILTRHPDRDGCPKPSPLICSQ